MQTLITNFFIGAGLIAAFLFSFVVFILALLALATLTTKRRTR